MYFMCYSLKLTNTQCKTQKTLKGEQGGYSLQCACNIKQRVRQMNRDRVTYTFATPHHDLSLQKYLEKLNEHYKYFRILFVWA